MSCSVLSGDKRADQSKRTGGIKLELTNVQAEINIRAKINVHGKIYLRVKHSSQNDILFRIFKKWSLLRSSKL